VPGVRKHRSARSWADFLPANAIKYVRRIRVDPVPVAMLSTLARAGSIHSGGTDPSPIRSISPGPAAGPWHRMKGHYDWPLGYKAPTPLGAESSSWSVLPLYIIWRRSSLDVRCLTGPPFWGRTAESILRLACLGRSRSSFVFKASVQAIRKRARRR